MKTKRYGSVDKTCHAWAHQLSEAGSPDNRESIFFEGPILYSYRYTAPIGILATKDKGTACAVLSTHNYSPTTGKHQSKASGAVSHLIRLSLPILSRYGLKESFTDSIHLLENSKTYILHQIAKARKPEIYLNQWEFEVAKITTFFESFKNQLELNATQVETYQKLIEPLTGEAIDYAKTRIAENKLQEKRKAEEYARAFPERLQKWRDGELEGYSIGCPNGYTYLRVLSNPVVLKDICAETSKGITFTLPQVIMLYKAFKRGKLLGMKHSNFTVTEVNHEKQTVTSGCHTIPFSEIELLASTLGINEQ